MLWRNNPQLGIQPANICSLSSRKTLKGSKSSNNFWCPTLFPFAQFGDGNVQISLFLSSSIICSGAHSLLANTNTDVHTSGVHFSMWKWKDCLFHQGIFAVWVSFFVFSDLPFQFRQLHWCIKLPVKSHKNQEIITLQQSIPLQLCAEVR